VFSLFFQRFTVGTLMIELPSGERLLRRAALPGPEAIIKIARWRALRRLFARGDIGFAEGYLENDWTTPDLIALFNWAHANEAALAPAWRGSALERLADRLRHVWRANTKRGSRRNIAAHHDLGNAFYAAWLDSSLSYSSAIFESPKQSLEDAQAAKISRAIELLEIERGCSVLEIGCGWGALAVRLTTKHDCRVTGLTLSREQHAIAAARIEAAGGADKSEIIIRDYRDVTETFDRIVSIEMFEAAGEEYWPLYFNKLRDCLRPGGVAVLQVISIEEERFADYQRRPDFIQRYIFPGGMLPTVGHLHSLARNAGLTLDHEEHFGQSYARTLAIWRAHFLKAWPSMAGAVGTERFRNMWDYYLAYCEVGFRTGALDVGLYRLRRSD
jgi:cyclopropane-fatty-acyl-phospholipid synthase